MLAELSQSGVVLFQSMMQSGHMKVGTNLVQALVDTGPDVAGGLIHAVFNLTLDLCGGVASRRGGCCGGTGQLLHIGVHILVVCGLGVVGYRVEGAVNVILAQLVHLGEYKGQHHHCNNVKDKQSAFHAAVLMAESVIHGHPYWCNSINRP